MSHSDRMDEKRAIILATASVANDRIHTLAKFAAGKSTLNVGCVGTMSAGGIDAKALARHARIAAAAAECTGLDIEAEGVEELRRRGYHALVGDACSCTLGRKFDAIIAGEVIEHVSNAGQFFSNMRRHLTSSGIFAVSTCNPFSPKRFWKILRYGHPCVHPEHTAWYDPVTLMGLGIRCGLCPRQLIWIQEPAGLDLRVWPRVLRRYLADNFVLAFSIA